MIGRGVARIIGSAVVILFGAVRNRLRSGSPAEPGSVDPE
jgi:hypothetical protein